MAIVTGDRYLDLLARFVDEQAGGLLDGSLVLKLNPVGLHYVQTRLDALHELERLRTGAPVDYLRAYISDLGDHRALEQLSRVLSLLTSVKVVSVLPYPARDPSPVTLSPFGRLKSLELRGCDLSTSSARGLLQLRPILERLICHNSADALRHIFMERILEVKDSPVWSRLMYVSCASNGMVLMDESLQLLPVVEFLDLSRNRFAKADNLHRCTELKFLDLGFNQLRNISSLLLVKSPITKLVLKNNALVSVHGVAALTCLEAVDLSNNLISKFKEIQFLASLPCLQILLLEGNPITASILYREEVFSFFQDPSKVSLDGRKISKSESWTVNKIKSRRLKREALYGSYAPAQVTADLQSAPSSVKCVESASEAGFTFSKRKVSRLALIHDAETSLKEPVEQDESPKFTPREAKEKRQDLSERELDKPEAIQLMQTAEALKEEGSSSWLQELKKVLDNYDPFSGDQQHILGPQDGIMRLKIESGLQNSQKRHSRRHHRSFKKDLFQNSLDIDGQSENDTAACSKRQTSPSSSQFVDNSSATSPKTSFDHEIFLESPRDHSSSIEVDRSKHHASMNAADEEQTSMDESFGSWKLIDDVIDAYATRGTHGSPPHYHEEVLQKRQDLEEELLRLSFDSGCAPSSSESESSSDDSLIMISSSSRSEENSPRGTSNSKLGGFESRIWDASRCRDNQIDDNASNISTKEESISGPEGQKPGDVGEMNPSAKEKATEESRSGHLSPSCTDDIRANAGGGEHCEFHTVTDRKFRKRRKLRKVSTVELYSENDMISLLSHGSSSNSNSLISDRNSTLSSEFKIPSEPLIQELMEQAETESSVLMSNNGVCSSSGIDDNVGKFFNLKIANASNGEFCIKCVRCGCIRLWEESPMERDVHFVVSNKDKLYMIAISTSNHNRLPSQGSGFNLHAVASHGLEEVRRIVVGLGLQALRVDIGHQASYLILARDIDVSREILEMLQKNDINGPSPDLESQYFHKLDMLSPHQLGAAADEKI
ncbi:hypothetical protein KP509_1Z168600 [Ceratopteris richardii]|nr:hypothetical protein KP509_1Z168600 [Ceratopteris richardii]